MGYTVVIPARFGSTRLPGKPLLQIDGKPMVQRVWEQAKASRADRVVIATDDARITDAAAGFGAESCMTSIDHVSGTDRLQQVAKLLQLDADSIVVNVQGDEPLIPPTVIDQVAANLAATSQAGVATLCEPILAVDELYDPNVVKVVRNAQSMALYFSRAPMPWPRDIVLQQATSLPQSTQWQRHIGLYAYRVSFLDQFVGWQPAPQEQIECLEQLRALHHGVEIHVANACTSVPAGIDTEADLAQVRGIVGALRDGAEI